MTQSSRELSKCLILELITYGLAYGTRKMDLPDIKENIKSFRFWRICSILNPNPLRFYTELDGCRSN
jgi:hypothetical protein